MKTAGIIVEYNPLHNGHVHHFQETKTACGADAVIAVMSGHFLQRGEPAIVGKWARTQMALDMGVDLVLELPVIYSVQPAEWFAYGAVSALHYTGVVDFLCFGSESGDITWMHRLSHQLAQESQELQRAVKHKLRTGVNFPSAYTAALVEMFPDTDETELAKPNNTLGLHYLIALQRLASPIQPLTIPRIKSGYNETEMVDKRIASATALRKLMLQRHDDLDDGNRVMPSELQNYVPSYVLDVLEEEFQAGQGPITWDSFTAPLMHILHALSTEELASFHEVSEGLEHRIKRTLAAFDAKQSINMETLFAQMKTKRYTHTKLQRAFTRILLQHRKTAWGHKQLQQGTPYLRVLGFTQTGRKLLKRMKRTAKVPIITNVSKQMPPLLEWDIRATSVYALSYQNPSREDLYRDYIQAPLQQE